MRPPPRQQKRFKRYLERGIPFEKLQSLILDDDPPDLQEDHVASRQHDRDLVAPVSRKAHVPRLERNRDASRINRQNQPDPVERVMWSLRSTAVFLELLAEAMWRWSNDLETTLTDSNGRLMEGRSLHESGDQEPRSASSYTNKKR
jgi:hypothetical protein